MVKGQQSDEDQVHVEASASSDGDSDWSGRIRASIARLMEIDGINMDPESSAKIAEKAKARMVEQAFNERVDQLEAATVTAHKEYSDRLRHVYSASTAKKMKLTSAEPLRTTAMQSRNDYEALDALAMAAASGARHVNEQAASMNSMKGKNAKRTYSLLRNSLPLRDRASKHICFQWFGNYSSKLTTNLLHDCLRLSLGDGAATKRSPIQVHDPTLAQAVDKLTNKLMQLLVQLEAASDAAATVESIMAAVSTIASETTEMGRVEETALARIMEIEEHRLQIMQGLLEYAKRKEEWKHDQEETKDSVVDTFASTSLSSDTNANDTEADEKHIDTHTETLEH
ncbi:unnamed protein product [Peronospora farinosa]|uniref:Uncharacterized protein n=1 Tax=Peronospora farinosa TaxID=134698 RepID=A0AAV0UN93_9STRA|nr:unnamed protein product [Peronospora farinosa]